MPSFFDKSFKEQVESIIRTGDLKLLQAFIGIRNPIGLLQYYSSFIITKINIMDARLHGEYKVQERCLKQYKNNMIMEDIEEQSRALCISDNTNLHSKLVSDISKDVRKELLTNMLLPITNKGDKSYDSICNTDYMCSSISDQDLISYIRNTEISSLCSMDTKQIIEMYDTFVHKSRNLVKRIIERNSFGSLEQKKEISEELSVLRRRIIEQEGEITKYKNSLGKVKERSFLREWYNELMSVVGKEAQEKKGHILHEGFPKDIRRASIFMEKLRNRFTLEVISRLLKEIVSDRCSKEQFDYLQDIMTDQLVDGCKLDYQYLVEEVNAKLKEEINKCDNKFKEILELIINKIKPDKVMKAEQDVLNDMLLEAVTQGKQDSALLLICNGANINLEKENKDKTKIKVRERLDEEILKKTGFLVIRKLYSDMPSIKASLRLNLDIQIFNQFVVEGSSQYVQIFNEFVVEGSSQSVENFKEFKVEDIFTLAEISDASPDNTVTKKAADSLVECDKGKLIIKEQIMQKQKVLYELQKKFSSKKEEYTKPSWKWAALVPMVVIPWYSLAYAALYVGACLAYTAVDVGRPWNARRNAQNELEIAQEDLDRATKMFEVFLECLQHSVVAGSDIFKERCKEIEAEIANIKKNKGKWVNLSSVLSAFENAQKVSSESASCFNTKSIKFSELAGDIICNRMRYMDELSQPDQPCKSTGQTVVAEGRGNVEEEEREKRKKTEAKNETLVDIITRFQRGELPASALQNMNIESLGSLVLCIQPNGQKKLLALSGWAVLSAISWYAGYSWWPGLLDLYFASRIKEYVRMYNEEVMLSHPRNEGYSGYVESIRGLVDVSEFEMHVTYLHGISSEALKKYKKHLLATTLVNHKETRKRFLGYVEALRSGEIANDEFEVHVSRLREYASIKINKEERYRYSTLFDETKKFFWNVVPSGATSENESINNLYRILSKIDYEKAILGEVLKSLNLLELVGNYNIELVEVIKKMLFQYHPDRNEHEKAKEIFTLIKENINNPIFIILEDFEKYTNCSYTSCQLDEFLTWRIGKIKEIREEEERNLHHILEDRGKKSASSL
ncbi:uncharacterized protein TNCT_112881 [Trichonephila clavata]|uniref:Uncharacterized protein n=1 Tax=Trichonephila clavata TaxID=2740835 RepID=A0A8X6LFW7_TRICU|nr:uncharacterized protein TNCT_112881 [Trichonephila clavata]